MTASQNRTAVAFVDHSAYSAWHKCPGFWHERYVNKRIKKWPASQRDDALAKGTLVHAGIEEWLVNGRPAIPQEVVDRINPTPEALLECKAMVEGYSLAYPAERWEVVRCEEALRFPLIPAAWPVCVTCNKATDWEGLKQCFNAGHRTTRITDYDGPCDGLAKLDCYFYLPTQTQVESGTGGFPLTLEPGWWLMETKTKSPDIPRGEWQQQWRANMQISFQMLALDYHLNRPDAAPITLPRSKLSLKWEPLGQVRGALINVIDKPKVHIPKRTCQSCKATVELAAFAPCTLEVEKGKGKKAHLEEVAGSQCPFCGHQQVFPPRKVGPPTPPAYWRCLAVRTPEELARDKEEIAKVARQMMAMKTLNDAALARTRCVETWPRLRECEYAGCHLAVPMVSTIGNEEFCDAEDYVGENKEEAA